MDFDATFIFAALSFIVFVFIMNAILCAPILKIMKERQNYVETNFKSAKDSAVLTEEKKKYREEELEKSRNEARLKISDKRKCLKEERSKELSEFRHKLTEDISNEKETLKQSAYDAKDRLKDNVVDIAAEISSKLFGDSVKTDSINKSMIDEHRTD